MTVKRSTRRRRLIATAGWKGGCGKSTAARLLAAFLQARGYRVLGLDANPPFFTFARWFGKRRDLDPLLVESFMEARRPGVLHVEATADPIHFELGELWDYVIVDLPGHMSPLTRDVLLVCDTVIMPFNLSDDDLDTRDILFSEVVAAEQTRLSRPGGTPLTALVLMNSVPPGKCYQRDIRSLAATLPTWTTGQGDRLVRGFRMLKAQLSWARDWKKATSIGLIPSELNPTGRAAADLRRLALEIRGCDAENP